MMQRMLDRLLALALLALFVPVAALLWLARRPRLKWLALYGQLGSPVRYPMLRLSVRPGPLRALNYLALLLPVLQGRIAIVGPRVVARRGAPPAYTRYGVRPGLLSPFTLQRRACIAHDSRDESDARFIRKLSLVACLSVLGRFLLSLLIGREARVTPDSVNLLGIEVANRTMESALAEIATLARGERCRQVAFMNADCFNASVRDPAYRAVLGRTALTLADGIGVRQALKWFLGSGLRDNVNGTDLFPRLCRMAAGSGLSLYLLGAQPGVAAAVAANARARFPELRVAGTHGGFFDESETGAVIEDINRSGADILLVAMGAPRQEKWISAHAPLLRVKVAMGVGGLFDFYAGRIARAPLWMREVGLEWIYRLMQEPGRMWRRYVIGNPAFLFRVWRWSRAQRAQQRTGAGAHAGRPPAAAREGHYGG